MQRRRLDPTAIILHHTQDTTKGDQYAKTKRYHMQDLGFGAIGYHGFIERSGQYIAGRPLELRGAHSTSRNKDALGLCLAGDFRTEKPTAAQLKTAARKVAEWSKQYPTIKDVLPHYAVDNTDCPASLPVDAIAAAAKAKGQPTQKDKKAAIAAQLGIIATATAALALLLKD